MDYHISFEKFVKNSLYLKNMQDFVANANNICPEKEKVFRFLNCNVSNAKCVILGMDPYFTTYVKESKTIPVATGRAFEVGNIDYWTDKYKQTSLSNIFKALCKIKFKKIYKMEELRKIVNKDNFKYYNIHDWFDDMEKQGVIFLNASLTTLVGKSGAHEKIWKDFVDELINYIVTINKNIKWLIWGEAARKRVSDIVFDKNIIYTCHPASRVKNTFVNDCCFDKIKNIKWV